MARFFFPILLLEFFCIWHVFNNDKDQKWYFIIGLIPLFGSLYYLYDSIYLSSTVASSSANPAALRATNARIKELEALLEVTDTVSNRSRLADEYFKIGDYKKARKLFESCRTDGAHDDVGILIKLVDICYALEDYKTAISYGDQINGVTLFDKSEEKTAYAWAYYHEDRIEEAEQVFKEMDSRYSNYVQRLEFAKFYIVTEREPAAKEVLAILIEELDSMHQEEQRLKKGVIKEIKAFYKGL